MSDRNVNHRIPFCALFLIDQIECFGQICFSKRQCRLIFNNKMLTNDQDDSCFCLGMINGSAKSFVQTYDQAETNIQILLICMTVFALTICEDFYRALSNALKD